MVEISSCDDDEEEADDGDIIMSSEEEEEREEERESSGSHVNDLLNHADESGQVLVNLGHPTADPTTDVYLAPQLAEPSNHTRYTYTHGHIHCLTHTCTCAHTHTIHKHRQGSRAQPHIANIVKAVTYTRAHTRT